MRRDTTWILSGIGIAILSLPAMDCIVQQPPPAVQPVRPAQPGDPDGPGSPRPGGEAPAQVARPMLFAVYGDTPSVAWSPSGRYLAVTHAEDYLGENDPEQAGIAVIDTRTGESEFWVRGNGYHPVWLDEQTIAYGCSPYECDDRSAGIYLVGRGGDPRLVLGRGVYHTRLGGPDQVLFYAGWPGEDGWMIWSRRDGSQRVVAGDEPRRDFGASWFPPANHLVDQCPSQVGQLAVRSDAAGVYLVDAATGGQERIAEATPWTIRTDVIEDGVIRPCLSPSGDHAVYFTTGAVNQVGVVPLR